MFTFVIIMENATIENTDLKEMSVKIKALYPNWISKVAEYISRDKDWKEYSNNQCTEDNARHISNGTIKSQLHRRLFMKAAAKMLLDVKKDMQGIESLVNQTA